MPNFITSQDIDRFLTSPDGITARRSLGLTELETLSALWEDTRTAVQANSAMWNLPNGSCDSVLNIKNISSCPGTDTISISANLDLNGYSIDNVSDNSITFKSGARITSSEDGLIQVLPKEGAGTIFGSTSAIPSLSGQPALSDKEYRWTATADTVDAGVDCWQAACEFVQASAAKIDESVKTVNEDFEFMVDMLEVVTGIHVPSGLSALEDFPLDGYGPGGKMPFIAIGDTENPADPDTGFGNVDKEFRISKYEVSYAQISAFNADPVNDTTEKRIPLPGSQFSGPNKPDGAIRVKPYDAMRFINWLNTSQGYPPAYNISDDKRQSGPVNWPLSADTCRSPEDNGPPRLVATGARYTLPTEDQWYKAAYYDPDYTGGNDKYWSADNRSDEEYTSGHSPWDVYNPEEIPTSQAQLSANAYNIVGMGELVAQLTIGENDSLVLRGEDYMMTGTNKETRRVINDGKPIQEYTPTELNVDLPESGFRVVDKGKDFREYGSCGKQQREKVQDQFAKLIGDAEARNAEFKQLRSDLNELSSFTEEISGFENCCEALYDSITSLSASIGSKDDEYVFMKIPKASGVDTLIPISQGEYTKLGGDCDVNAIYVIK